MDYLAVLRVAEVFVFYLEKCFWQKDSRKL